MKVDTAVTLFWAPVPFVCPEIAQPLIKEKIQEMCARFVPIRVLNNLLRTKWFTLASKRTLATSNGHYSDYTCLPSGPRYHCLMAVRSIDDSKRNHIKVMF